MRYIVIAVVVDGRKQVAGCPLENRRSDIVGATPTATAAFLEAGGSRMSADGEALMRVVHRVLTALVASATSAFCPIDGFNCSMFSV